MSMPKTLREAMKEVWDHSDGLDLREASGLSKESLEALARSLDEVTTKYQKISRILEWIENQDISLRMKLIAATQVGFSVSIRNDGVIPEAVLEVIKKMLQGEK